MDVTVLIASYGNTSWIKLAERAVSSLSKNVKYITRHEQSGTLASVRNNILKSVDTEFVCYLDADDELEAGFFEAMAESEADIRAPAVRYINPNGTSYKPPMMPNVSGHTHNCVAECLIEGNWLVIGSVAPTELMRKLQWRDYPVYEDFCVWQRAYISGASFDSVPHAIYHAHVRPKSRNHSLSRNQRRLVHYEIAKTNLPHMDWEYLKP